MSKDLWVTADGTWGTNGIKRFDTTNWQPEDWDRLDNEMDWLKLDLATKITKKRNKQAQEKLINDLQQIPIRTFIIGTDGSLAEEERAFNCPSGDPNCWLCNE
jgi:hypothetical protein